MELNTWHTVRHVHTSAAARVTYDPFTDSFTATVAISGAADDPSFHFTQTNAYAVTCGGKRRAVKFARTHLNRADW